MQIQTSADQMITALSDIKRLSVTRYLGTGETYTLTLITVAILTLGFGRVQRQGIYAMHTLSKSSVDSHVRTLVKMGLVRRDGDSLSLVDPAASRTV